MRRGRPGYLAHRPTGAERLLSVRDSGQFHSTKPKIVVIGGGSGSAVVLQGLKHHAAEITSIVTMFDSGGSSGLLRREFGYPPFGDLRQCLMALSEESEPSGALQSLLGFRFCKDSSLHGHNVGNLLLAALTTLYDVEEAIDELARILRIHGRVVPVSLDQADLCAELEDGSILKGETTIDLRGSPSPRIIRAFLEPAVEANPRALQAILEADAVILGPGDLYTSIIPNLLVQGVPEALGQTRATLTYVCNLMTKRGETDDFKASDFVREINRYLGGATVEWVVVNTAPVRQEIQERYAGDGARPVETDKERLAQLGVKYVGCPVANTQTPLRHDPAGLAAVLLCLASLRGVPKLSLPSTGFDQASHLGRHAAIGAGASTARQFAVIRDPY